MLAIPGSALGALSEPPTLPHSITVFPERDFISASGFAEGESVIFNVLRNGVTIATSTPVPASDPDPTDAVFDGLAEVNHPGGGCWTNTTPDILPGDVVRTTIVGTETQDQTTTANVTVDLPTNPAAGTIVVTGTAQTAGGAPLPLDEIEQRLISSGAFANGRRRLQASAVGGDGTLAYDAPGSISFTATYTSLSDADVALALSSESRSLWLGSNPGSGAELTIYENPVVGGPAAPCTAPLAVNGVTAIDHVYKNAPVVNIANVGTDLGLEGLAEAETTAVAVQITDGAGDVTAMVDGTLSAAAGPKTWTATVPAAQVAGLADGTLNAAVTVTTPAGSFNGSPFAIRKDTSAPSDPTVSPGPGTYATSQAVLLSGADPAADIHYTVDGSEPGEVTAVATGQILITSSLTLRAIAIDPSGNSSAIKDFAYTITPVVTPPAGGGGTPTGGGGTPTGGGGTPTGGGGAPTGGAGTPAGAGATAGSQIATGPGTTTAKPKLVLKSLGLAPRIKQRKARRSGLRLVMRVPEGTEVVKVNVYRKTAKGLKLISSGFRAPPAAGLYRVSQSHAALRRLLKKGSYEVQVTPGYSRSDLGTTTKASFKVI